MKLTDAICIGICIGLFCVLSTLSAAALGHGGVYLEDDVCVIKIGFYEAHFTIFQPQTRGHEQYCEDLPDVTDSVFVLEYSHDGLETMPVDFRIIENTTNMGLFANWQDIEQIDDLDAVTVFYEPVRHEPDVFTVIHKFANSGQYIGIVTSKHPDNGILYTAVFPFEVGYAGINYLAVGGSIVLIALALWISTLLRGLWRNRAAAATAMMVGVLIASYSATAYSADSDVDNSGLDDSGLARTDAEMQRDGGASYEAEGTYYRVSASSELQPLRINRMHKWRLRIYDKQGRAVDSAQVVIDGGMPEHDHGLSTQPQVTQTLGNGIYLIDGMKFHMHGQWVINFTITADRATEVVAINIDL